jgi:hypothetical protein
MPQLTLGSKHNDDTPIKENHRRHYAPILEEDSDQPKRHSTLKIKFQKKWNALKNKFNNISSKIENQGEIAVNKAENTVNKIERSMERFLENAAQTVEDSISSDTHSVFHLKTKHLTVKF